MPARTFFAALAAILCLAAAPPGRNAFAAPAHTQEDSDLQYIREEEKVARDSYITFNDLWGLAVFANIMDSEQRHMNAVLALLEKYGLPDPAAGKGVGVFTNPALQKLYDTLTALGSGNASSALQVGGLIEETDIQDITAAIGRARHEDIVKTYETLMCGSRNHLRSFAELVAKSAGQPYKAQVLPQDQVNKIIASPMEQCGNGNRQKPE